MKPQSLLDPDSFPEDLHWLATEYKLHPGDPVFLLIAWHWHRVKAGEDSLKAATIEFQAAVDTRVQSLNATGEAAAQLHDKLADIEKLLTANPLQLGKKLEADLERPVTATVARINSLESSLRALLQSADTVLAASRRRQAFTTFVLGLFCGSMATLILA